MHANESIRADDGGHEGKKMRAELPRAFSTAGPRDQNAGTPSRFSLRNPSDGSWHHKQGPITTSKPAEHFESSPVEDLLRKSLSVGEIPAPSEDTVKSLADGAARPAATKVVSADHVSNVGAEAMPVPSAALGEELGEYASTLAVRTPEMLRASPHSAADDMRFLEGTRETFTTTVARLLQIVGDLQGAIEYATTRIEQSIASTINDVLGTELDLAQSEGAENLVLGLDDASDRACATNGGRGETFDGSANVEIAFAAALAALELPALRLLSGHGDEQHVMLKVELSMIIGT
ncbi:hypothetical protein FA95DRAFT_1577431 [Auriscalpium vulgare]|uniref:Uncharacterized protein n=1 Tax=Auriscalpium vulgare TaxID=40419 RepID=A0ACB8R6C4_9AGAM|nr:hypothetical protein FA95DRAFT_1577431 [Auriscalpium vulgare]